jgi:3-hydroxyisobutyrate dehydrogenase
MTPVRPVAPGDAIGFIGLGRMGQPMTFRLAAAGYRVSAFDISPAAREAAAVTPGIEAASSVAGAGSDARAVILMLPNSEIVTDVVLNDGLLQAMPDSALLVDMSSSDATQTRELASTVDAYGVRFVDAPVSGGVTGAQAGTLTIMAGGAEEDVDACRPMLEAMGEAVRHVGAIGSGHAIKALNNLCAGANLLVGIEALQAAERFGLEADVVLDVINHSSGMSWSSTSNLPKFIVPGTFDSGFAMSLIVKDIRMAVGLARAVGSQAALGEAAVSVWEQAAEALPPDADHTEIARWLTARADRRADGRSLDD